MNLFYGVGVYEEPIQVVKEFDAELSTPQLSATLMVDAIDSVEMEVDELVTVLEFSVDNSNQESE